MGNTLMLISAVEFALAFWNRGKAKNQQPTN